MLKRCPKRCRQKNVEVRQDSACKGIIMTGRKKELFIEYGAGSKDIFVPGSHDLRQLKISDPQQMERSNRLFDLVMS